MKTLSILTILLYTCTMAQETKIDWYSINNGFEVVSESGTKLGGVVGQSTIGEVSDGSYTITGGFLLAPWYCPADSTPPAPEYLIWRPAGVVGPSWDSADSILAALQANGRDASISDDLFAWGTDLSIYNAIFVVLGIAQDSHIMDALDPEPPALEAYLFNGGNLFVEGGDCFVDDPDFNDGYDIRPWFDLGTGANGQNDLTGVTGLNDLSAFAFDYTGTNRGMDELVPQSSSTIWQNNANSDISGVFYDGFGSGRAIGVVPSFGGFSSSSAPQPRGISPHSPVLSRQSLDDSFGPPRVKGTELAEPSPTHSTSIPTFQHSNIPESSARLIANNQTDLMAAYLDLLEPPAGTPTIVVQGTAVSDFENDTLRYYINEGVVGYDQPLNIRNMGDADLVWSITDEDSTGADCPNISVAPSDSVTMPGSTTQIIISMVPTGLQKGNTYYCDMLIASNDPATPVYTITVCINVLEKWAEFMTEVQSIPPGQPIAPGDSIRDLFTFINYTGADQRVMIETKWLRNTGQVQQQMNPRYPDLSPFEVNTNRNKKFAVPTTMPPDTNWVVSYIYTEDGLDTICTDTAAFEVVAANNSELLAEFYLSGIPEKMQLHRNYPNPFNPTTTIRYDLSQSTYTSINIYNILGQHVRTLVEGFEEAGYKQMLWDGRDDAGNPVASGIYVYRMVVKNIETPYTQIHKMVLMK